MLRKLSRFILYIYNEIMNIINIFTPQTKRDFFYSNTKENDFEKYLPHQTKGALRQSGLNKDWSATINQFMLFTVGIYIPTQIWFSDKPWVLYFSIFGAILAMFIKGFFGRKSWQATFSGELARAMRIIHSGLSVGLSIEECLHDASNYTTGTVQREFRDIALKIQAGMPISETVDSSRDRITDPSFDVFGYVLTINEQIGGSLAPVFERLMYTLDQKNIFEKKIATLTSENKNTALIVNSAVILMSLSMLEAGGTKEFFLQDPIGQKLALLQIFLIIANAFVVHYMTKGVRPF